MNLTTLIILIRTLMETLVRILMRMLRPRKTLTMTACTIPTPRILMIRASTAVLPSQTMRKTLIRETTLANPTFGLNQKTHTVSPTVLARWVLTSAVGSWKDPTHAIHLCL